MKTWKCSGDYHSVMEAILAKCGLTEEELLHPPRDPDVFNLKKLAAAIKGIPDKNIRIRIYADYDCDGVCGAYILKRFLIALGFKDVKVYFPSRVGTGYGFQVPAAMALVKEGCDVLITVDNGIAAQDAISVMKDAGATVFVVDHHPLADGIPLPMADIIVDPNADGGRSEYTYYCGAGLAYRLAKECGCEKATGIRELAAIATIADVMELKGDNRNIVRDGISLINEHRTEICPGLATLLEILGIITITTENIGYTVAPCINSADRMNEGAELPFRLFEMDSHTPEMDSLAKRLVVINESRKVKTNESMKKVLKRIEEDCLFGDYPLVVAFPEEDNDLLESLNGILAGRLADKFKTASFVLSLAKDGLLHGSARSYGDVDIKAAADKHPEVFVRYGGHAGALGMTVDPTRIDDCREALKEAMEDMIPEDDGNTSYYDYEITASQVPQVRDILDTCEPLGQGCPPPVFKITGFQLVPKAGRFHQIMGDGRVIKLYGGDISAISYELADEYKAAGEPKNLTLYGTITRNEYVGYHGVYTEVQVVFLDFEKEDVKRSGSLRDLLLKGLERKE